MEYLYYQLRVSLLHDQGHGSTIRSRKDKTFIYFLSKKLEQDEILNLLKTPGRNLEKPEWPWKTLT